MKIEPVDYICVSISQREAFKTARGLVEGAVPVPAWFTVELAPVRVIRPMSPTFGEDNTPEGQLTMEGQILEIAVKGSPGFFVVGRRYNLSIEERR